MRSWQMLNILCLLGVFLVAGCSPTVKVQAPQEPITINLNVKIEHEVRVKLEKTAEEAIDANGDLF